MTDTIGQNIEFTGNAEGLSRTLQDIQRKFQEVTKAAEDLGNRAGRGLTDALKGTQQQLDNAARSLNAFGQSVKPKDAVEFVNVLDQLSRRVEVVGQKVAKAHEQIGSSAKQAAADFNPMSRAIADVTGRLAGMVTVGAAINSAFNFADISRGFTQISQTARVTGGDVGNLLEKFQRLARETGFSVNEIQQGFREFQDTTGLVGEDLKRAFSDSALAAQALGVNMESIGKAVNAVMSNLKVTPEEMKGVLNSWMQIPGSVAEEVSRHMPRITSSLAALGIKGPEAAKSLGDTFSAVTRVKRSRRK